MTDVTPAPGPTAGGTLAIPEDDTGLEDFDFATDAVMPRLNIEHGTAKYKDSLSGEEFSSLTVVLLGLVKQRILWDDEVNEGDKPLCKSYNFQEGHPDPARFPFPTAGFDPAALETSADGGLVAPCAGCALKEWGSNPKNSTPWCSEQHTYPLLMQAGEDGGGWTPALLTVQRTGIKPSKAYLTAFARTKTPLYTVTTTLGLTPQKKGSVNYAVPTFTKGSPTDQEDWADFVQQFRSIREFISTPPHRDEESTTPVSVGASAPSAPSAGAAPAAPAGADDDLPF